MADTNHNEASGLSGAHINQARNVRDIYYNVPLSPPPPPMQAPPADLRYTNRETELAKIEDLAGDVFRRGRSGLALVSGRQGVGKSALLAEVGHWLADRFDAGTAMCDLTQVRDQKGQPDFPAALQQILRTFHVPDADQMSDVVALMARLRQATAQKRVLLLVDGAFDAAELDHFVLGSGPNLVVAAGVSEFAGTDALVRRGARPVPLRELTRDNGLRLLAEFPSVGRRTAHRDEHAQAQELVDLCGGLPAALRMAAAHLEVQEDLSIARLVSTIRARQVTVPRASGVEAVIDVALSGLGEPERRVLELLTVHPGRFFSPEVIHLVQGEQAPLTLERLEQANVLHNGTGPDRSIIELVNDRVRNTAPANDGQRAIDAAAILRFFTVTHHRADLASLGERYRLSDSLDTAELTVAPSDYVPPFDGKREATDWQDTHLIHTRDLMRLAVDLERGEAALLLADSCWPVSHGRRRLTHGISIYTYALQIARTLNHSGAEVRCAVYLARLYMERGDAKQGDPEQAAKLLERAGKAAEESDSDLDLAVVLETRGLLNGRFPRVATTEESDELSRSRGIHRRLGRTRGDALQTYQLGDQARQQGDLDTAEAELRDAERTADRRLAELERAEDGMSRGWLVDDWTLLRARVRLALARTLLDLDRIEEAKERAEAAWQVFHTSGEPVRQIHAMRFLARIAERAGDYPWARELTTRVEELAGHYHLEDLVREARTRLSELPAQREGSESPGTPEEGPGPASGR